MAVRSYAMRAGVIGVIVMFVVGPITFVLTGSDSPLFSIALASVVGFIAAINVLDMQ